jgi:hypothetical protein
MRRMFMLVGLLLMGGAAAAFAQDAPQPQRQPQPQPRRDFLFGEPRGWVSAGGTYLFPRAGGQLFTFVTNQLTLDRRDFQTPAMVAQVGIRVTSRISFSADLEFSENRLRSEFRGSIDNFGLPIQQTTKLAQQSVGASVKWLLVDPGRSISRLAYVPRNVIPYVGGGGGMLHYELQQTGDFVDARTQNVFNDVFTSSAWTPSGHVFAGTDIRIFRGLFFVVEGRYVSAIADLGPDFVGFDGIDLAGFRVSTGLHIAF